MTLLPKINRTKYCITDCGSEICDCKPTKILNDMRNLSLESRKDNTYYDKNGRQILVGDLLKVFHFRGSHRKKYYMYQVAVMEDSEFPKDSDRFPVMAVADYQPNSKPHCRMYVCVNENRIYETAEIVQELDFETKRKRIKI